MKKISFLLPLVVLVLWSCQMYSGTLGGKWTTSCTDITTATAYTVTLEISGSTWSLASTQALAGNRNPTTLQGSLAEDDTAKTVTFTCTSDSSYAPVTMTYTLDASGGRLTLYSQTINCFGDYTGGGFEQVFTLS